MVDSNRPNEGSIRSIVVIPMVDIGRIRTALTLLYSKIWDCVITFEPRILQYNRSSFSQRTRSRERCCPCSLCFWFECFSYQHIQASSSLLLFLGDERLVPRAFSLSQKERLVLLESMSVELFFIAAAFGAGAFGTVFIAAAGLHRATCFFVTTTLSLELSSESVSSSSESVKAIFRLLTFLGGK
jgi:hypothetical protein